MSTHYFNDENTLEDILGSIYVAQGYESYYPGQSPIPKLDQIVGRIEAKLATSTNRIRRNWFSIALDFARQARAAYAAGDSVRGFGLLKKTEEYLVSGNKAHRRKTAFIVAPDGVAHSVSDAPDSTQK
jgi:hypothetical protein